MRRCMVALAVALIATSQPASFSPAQCAWSGLGSGLDGPSTAASLVVSDDGGGEALFVGGLISSAGGLTLNGIGRWDGQAWSALGGGLLVLNGLPGRVFALATFDDGTGRALYAGGGITSASGTPVNGLARWDGQLWAPVGGGVTGGAPLLDKVAAMAVWDDGSGPALYVAGNFDLAGSVAANSIARWDGMTWTPVGSGMNLVVALAPTVQALAVFDDGGGPALYAGGIFTIAGGVSANGIARWNGAAWLPLGGGVSGSGIPGVSALAVYDPGSGPALYAGGTFALAGGAGAQNIARWDGAGWAPLGGGLNGPVRALAVFDDGTGPALYAGGSFTQAGGVAAPNLARWDGSFWAVVGNGTDGDVDALGIFDDGGGPALHLGGAFTTAGGTVALKVAKYTCGSTISITPSQMSGPGSAVFLANANLTPEHEYWNVFSVDPCPGGVGTGPVLGLCGADPSFLFLQVLLPLGTPPSHFKANGSYMVWGPFLPFLPPATLDLVCFDGTGAVLGPVSPVARIAVQ